MSKFLTVIAFFIAVIAHAQAIKFEESAAFEEPRDGWLRLMQLNNGNTALLHFTEDDILNLKLFSPTRQTIADKKIPLKFQGKGISIASVLNIGNEIVVFGGKAKDWTPTMYRATIDASTGNLKKIDEIAQLKKMNMGDGYALTFGGVPAPRIEIRKDLNSDNYGIVLFNSLVSDRSKRIEVVHFGADHKELSRAFFSSPDNEAYKYMELLDFVVIGDSKMLVSAFVFNEKGDNSFLSVATLKKGENKVESKILSNTKDMVITHGLLRYNPTENLVALLGLDYIGREKRANKYQRVFALINPDNLELQFTKLIEQPAVDAEFKKIFGDKEDYNPLTQDLIVNEDNTYSVIFQENKTTKTAHYRMAYDPTKPFAAPRTTTMRSMGMGTPSHTYSDNDLGSVAVTHLNSKAIETSGYLVPMEQQVRFVEVPGTATFTYGPMYIANRNVSSQKLRDGLQFKSFMYINGKNGNYVIFNDLRENLEKIKKGKLNQVTTISDTDAFIYTLKDGQVTKEFLFGDGGEKVHNFALVSVSSFDRPSGTFATLKLENSKGKKMKVVWAKL